MLARYPFIKFETVAPKGNGPMKTHITTEAMKAAPPVAVNAGALIGGYTVNEWVAFGTLAYLALQAAFLLWKWRKEAKRYAHEEASDA
jgi:predicted MFS family arabinose efflux permease